VELLQHIVLTFVFLITAAFQNFFPIIIIDYCHIVVGNHIDEKVE